jgi:hypothetical protein
MAIFPCSHGAAFEPLDGDTMFGWLYSKNPQPAGDLFYTEQAHDIEVPTECVVPPHEAETFFTSWAQASPVVSVDTRPDQSTARLKNGPGYSVRVFLRWRTKEFPIQLRCDSKEAGLLAAVGQIQFLPSVRMTSARKRN